MIGFLKDFAILTVALIPFYLLGESARYLWPELGLIKLNAVAFLWVGFILCKAVSDWVKDGLGYMEDE